MPPRVDLSNLDERVDAEAVVVLQAQKLAALLRRAKHAIAFTGAGLSTSAAIPDYRGPDGVWTREAQGRAEHADVDMRRAQPTAMHTLLADLVSRRMVKHVVTMNIDNLHRRSGVPPEALSEIHGNEFLEVCWSCGAEVVRAHPVRQVGKRPTGDCSDCRKLVHGDACHCTGNYCATCGHAMKDSIVHFGEDLPVAAWRVAEEHARKADLCIVLGSSLTVEPAVQIPERVFKRRKPLVIVNLQTTTSDYAAALRIFARTDTLAQHLRTALFRRGGAVATVDAPVATASEVPAARATVPSAPDREPLDAADASSVGATPTEPAALTPEECPQAPACATGGKLSGGSPLAELLRIVDDDDAPGSARALSTARREGGEDEPRVD